MGYDGTTSILSQIQSNENAIKFEEFVFDSIRTLFGQNRSDGAVMMNESDIRNSQYSDITPDILFNCSVNINGVDIYWMDCKHYYVTTKDVITFKSMGNQMANYVKSFGNGAIVCCGFQANFVLHLKQTYPEITGTILMLDASRWHSYA